MTPEQNELRDKFKQKFNVWYDGNKYLYPAIPSGILFTVWIEASYEAVSVKDPAIYAKDLIDIPPKNDFERVLFYHPESDSYVECLTKSEYDWLGRSGGEPLDEVTGIEHHEREFLKRGEDKDDFDDLLGVGYEAGDEDLLG